MNEDNKGVDKVIVIEAAIVIILVIALISHILGGSKNKSDGDKDASDDNQT